MALVTELILYQESDAEPWVDGFAPAADEPDDAGRDRIAQWLGKFSRERLQPLEERCSRVRHLAEGKGPTSLDTVVGQQFLGGALATYREQLDALCRSAWTYLHHRSVFEAAESFHFARQFRDHGKLYDAFEVDLDRIPAIVAADINLQTLAERITVRLELTTACTVQALDLPLTADYPASIMLIIRHGGALSSVFHHRDDGHRGTIYYRPPNEATLIFTPSLRLIEICADSPLVRQEAAQAFAEVTLGQDLSRRPLTWRRYNLTRFRNSFRLPLPDVNGVDLHDARVLEAEIRLGSWARKLVLKVGKDDDIEEVATSYLGRNNILQRAASYSSISIAVTYNPLGDAKVRTLNITVTGDKRSNLQNNKDPDARSLGYRLLQEWGILSAFRQINPDDLGAMLPAMLLLYDRGESKVSGTYLRELGLDPERLIEGGLLERCGRQEIVLLDDADGGDGTVRPSATPGMVRVFGSFGEDLGEHPAADLTLYEINDDWLYETLTALIRPILNKRGGEFRDPDLTLLGTMQINGAAVPVYFGRRLDDLKTLRRLDSALRARNSAGVGIVLSACVATLGCLGPNVVVPLHSALSCEEPDGPVLSRDALELAFRSQRKLAVGGDLPQVLRSGRQSATLHVPGKDPLFLAGNQQIVLFERLVAAAIAGSPDIQVKELMEGLGSRNPSHAFPRDARTTIMGIYIGSVTKRGYWRLLT